jgi:hypothetical protein
MLDKMNHSVVDNDMLAEREQLIADLADSLDTMTNLAAQWERLNGTPESTTTEIEAARKLIEKATAP